MSSPAVLPRHSRQTVLRRVLAAVLLLVVLLASVAFVSVASERMLQAHHQASGSSSARTVTSYGWSWWPAGVRTMYADGTESVTLW
jgi:hypothetical protein